MSVPGRGHVARRTSLMTCGVFPVASFLLQAPLLVACGEHVGVGREQAAQVVDAGVGKESGPGLDAGEILCGSNVCGTSDFGPLLGAYPPCCHTPTVCGLAVSNACIELNVAGVEDPSCPPLAPYAACCRPDGNCGVATGAPLGCVTLLGQTPGRCVYPAR